MSEQDNGQVTTLPRPTTDDREDWIAYWKQQGQPWRIQPEISKDRQTYLAKCLAAQPDTKQGRYPFKKVRLNRADIEWVLGQKISDFNLTEADLRGANLENLPLKEVDFGSAHLEGANLVGAHLEGASLLRAHLEGANLVRAHLEGADLEGTHLERAYLGETHLEGALLFATHLEGSDLDGAFFDANTALDDVTLGNKEHGFASVVGVHWNGADLSVIDWTQIKRIGDELKAHQAKSSLSRLIEYRAAVRANRQLAVALRDQGLSEDAAHFVYRAQLMQRKVFWYQRKIGQYLFSLFLDLLAGYGFKAWRSFVAYLIVITAFATAYFIIGHTVGPVLSPLGAFVFSMTSFHGRGFFPGGIGLDDPLTVLAAFEAFVGLLIEVTFIATLSQRLFGK